MSDKPTHNLEEYDLKKSRIFSQGWYRRELRLHNKRYKPLVVDFSKMSPQEIESELERGLKIGCKFDKIEAIKADYHIWNMIQEKMRGAELVKIAEDTQEMIVQEDGSILSESDIAQIDYQLAKCEPIEKIAARFGTSIESIQTRNIREQVKIVDLRRRLNSELEDSSIGIAHDFVRLEELQETLEIIKAHIQEFEDLRKRTDIDPEERLTRMAGIPNIISLLNTKEKIIHSAHKEMKARKEASASAKTEYELTSEEAEMFTKLHQELPLMELIVARASTDNGWDTSYMLSKLNKSIYKDFRRGEYGEDREIKKEKDMTLPYPSEQPVDLENVVRDDSARVEDAKLMRDRDIDTPAEAISDMEKKKRELIERIKSKANGSRGNQEKKDSI